MTGTAPAPSRPRVTQVVGEVLLTIGALILLFVFYESFWTNIESNRQQTAADDNLQQAWDVEGEYVNPRSVHTPELGEAFARMYIPAFGSDFQFAIMEGTDDTTLLAGPGRYIDTQMPGEAGNFAVAGHRVGKGAPFNDLGNLNVCDAVVVETQTAWHTYRVMPMDSAEVGRREEGSGCFTGAQMERLAAGDYADVVGRHITTPGDIGVINARPGAGSTTASADMESVMTMTTCHPQFSNAERMIIHAMLVESTPKTGDGFRPAALEES